MQLQQEIQMKHRGNNKQIQIKEDLQPFKGKVLDSVELIPF